jgi:ubiquinone/menaquinone biosynthesis C-methylase UbiE
MLTTVAKKAAPQVCYIRAAAGAFPLSEASVDMVFISMVFITLSVRRAPDRP